MNDKLKSSLENILNDFQDDKKSVGLDKLDNVLSLKFENTSSFRKDCILLINLEKFEIGLEYVEKFLTLFPNNPELLSRKGLFLEMLGKFEDAVEQYDLALKKDPENHHALKNKGMLLVNLGKYQKALEYFESVLKIHPDDNQVIFAKALTQELLGKNEESIPNYLDSLLIQRSDIESMHDFGFHFINRLKMDNPMDFYYKLSEKVPNEPFAEFFKQLIESEKTIEELYDKYLARNPDLDEIKFWQKFFLKGETKQSIEEKIKKSSEAKINISIKELEPKIVDLFRRILDRKNPSRDEINYFKNEIIEGKSIKWVEEQIKNSNEAKRLPYWQKY